jgi:hypothetical protein
MAILLLTTQTSCNDSLPPIFHHGVPPSNHIIAPTETRETSLTFEELQDILTAHETYLKRIEATQSQLMAIANNTQRSTVHYHQ